MAGIEPTVSNGEKIHLPFLGRFAEFRGHTLTDRGLPVGHPAGPR